MGRERYPIEVAAYRRRSQEQVALLVGTEADEQTVSQRMNCLAATLTDKKPSARVDHERITLWIPKWNVETWILSLLGNEVDESKSYKHKVKKPDYAAVAAAFVARMRECRDGGSESLPSLEIAFEETSRMQL